MLFIFLKVCTCELHVFTAIRQVAHPTGMPTSFTALHFYSPRWICRMGNYRTYEEAHDVLTKVKQLGYPSAVIVKGKITVYYP